MAQFSTMIGTAYLIICLPAFACTCEPETAQDTILQGESLPSPI